MVEGIGGMSVNRQEGKPLVILDSGEQVVDVQVMSRKAFTKSTEHGELWVVHEETGRVLPYEGEAGRRFTLLEEEGSWFRAVLAAHNDELDSSVDELDSSAGTPPAGPAGGTANAQAAGPTPARGRGARRGGPVDAGRTLSELAAVIARRKAERPEGSYTTYLFESGEEKIRKKTGEEAIELVLSRSRGELVSEAADLIYHLLVLLSQLEIPFEAVLEELHGRA